MPNTRVKFLYNIGQLYAFAEHNKIELICFTFYRDNAQQLQEFIKHKSRIKENGPHQKWTAQDLAIIEKGIALFDDSPETIAKYKVLGDFWKTLDPLCIWGGDFEFAADVYHFELSAIMKKEKETT
jgi:hypothetical protein